MNWYKRAQKENWNWTKLVSVVGLGILLSLATMKGTNLPEIQKEFEINPQQVIQEIQQVQSAEPNLPPTEPNLPSNEPNLPSEEPNQTISIDLDKIWRIESSRGTDPNMKGSSAGARGHFQFMEKTWNELVKRMGKNWDWWNDSMDYNKSKQVADFYLNKRIPEMLNYYRIPDNLETRLGAYNWGIGKLRKAWETGFNLPEETTEYIEKYNKKDKEQQ